MKIIAITQARLSSTRLPAKVLLPLGKTSVLGLHINRLKEVKYFDEIIVATTNEAGSEKICQIAEEQSVRYFNGSLNDVLDRFYQAAIQFQPEIVVRLTSDCPLIDPKYVEDLIEKFLNHNVDYASNCLIPNLPDGLDAEVMKFSALEKAWREAKLQSEREHVTPYIWKNCDVKGGSLFKGLAVDYGLKLQDYRITLDEKEDYEVIKALVDNLGENVRLDEIMKYLADHPEIRSLNKEKIPNAGYLKSLAQDSNYDEENH